MNSQLTRYRKDKKLYPKLFGCAALLFILLLVCVNFVAIAPSRLGMMIVIFLFHGLLGLYAVALGLRSYVVDFERSRKDKD